MKMISKKSAKSKRNVQKLTDIKFLNLYQMQDPDNNVGNFFYAERLGKDSVAFIGYDADAELFLVNKEYKPPVNKFITGAFGGSLDSDLPPARIVEQEVREEAGFEVDSSNVRYLGRVFVSTQMNQYCFLFLVSLSQKDQKDRQPENAIEAMATTKWVKEEEIYKMEEWKPITIVSLAKQQGVL